LEAESPRLTMKHADTGSNRVSEHDLIVDSTARYITAYLERWWTECGSRGRRWTNVRRLVVIINCALLAALLFCFAADDQVLRITAAETASVAHWHTRTSAWVAAAISHGGSTGIFLFCVLL